MLGSAMPPGQYTPVILAGLWGTNGAEVCHTSCGQRQGDEKAQREYASSQRRIRTTILSQQKGVTAEDLMREHNIAEVRHQGVADGHKAKAQAFQTSGDIGTQLRSDLRSIAAHADEQIKKIQQSKEKAPIKMAKITAIVTEARAEAIAKVAAATADTLAQVSRVLTETGQNKKADDLVKALDETHKIDMPSAEPNMTDGISKNGADITKGNLGNHAGDEIPKSPADVVVGNDHEVVAHQISHESGDLVKGGAAGNSSPGVGSAAGIGIGTGIPAGGVPGGGVPRVPSVPAASLPTGGGGGLPGGLGQALNPGNVVKSLGSAVSPENLASGFQAGMRAGGPAATQASSLSNALSGMSGGHASPAPTQGMPGGGVSAAPVVSVPHVAAPQEVAVAPTAQAAHAAPAAPSYVAPVQGPASGPVAPMTGGGGGVAGGTGGGALPSYGSDVRVSPTSNLVPPTPSSTALGGSVSTAPSGGAGVGSPSVVRQAPAAPAAAGAPLASAVAAPAAGAAAGAVTGAGARVTAEQGRCDDVVAVVARQEPRVRWAAATRSDGTILLVTDLAGGWIPPHVKTPEGVTLVSPQAVMWAPRRPLVDMLGQSVFQSVYEPGGEIGEATLPMSDWVRHVEDVTDMRWALRKASEWRDGLPRLAHTLAKAWATSAGVRPIEIEQLREQMTATSHQVIGAYTSGAVTGHVLGNWMLLAAIDALVGGDNVSGTYHFRWFEAIRQADTIASSSATG